MRRESGRADEGAEVGEQGEGKGKEREPCGGLVMGKAKRGESK